MHDPDVEEDYGAFLTGKSKGNLTHEQQRYAECMRRINEHRSRGGSLNCIVLGFRASDNGAMPLSDDVPIRRVGLINSLALIPVMMPSFDDRSRSRWRNRGPAEKLRMHFVEQQAAIDRDGAVYEFRKYDRHWNREEYNLMQEPRQRKQVYRHVDYSPSLLGEMASLASSGKPTELGILRSPVAGTVSVVRDDLFLRILINNETAYRFPLDRADRVEVTKRSGDVKAHDQLGHLTGEVTRAEAVFHNNRARWERVQGAICASGDTRRLRLATRMLETMADWLTSKERPTVASLGDFLPRYYVELENDVVINRRTRGWRATATFQQRLLHAVSPDSLGSRECLQMVAPVSGTLESAEWSDTYRVLRIRRDDGSPVLLTAPICATLLVKVGDPVQAGKPLADYVSREYYANYDRLREVSQGAISKLEDELFDRLCLRPGQLGYTGLGLAVESGLAGSLTSLAVDHWGDFTETLKFRRASESFVVSPAIPFDASIHGFQLSAYGLNYDFSPVSLVRAAARQARYDKANAS